MSSNEDFNPENFLSVANHLSTTPADEAFLRSAVGRAYYCAYHLALTKVNHERPGAIERVRKRRKRAGMHIALVEALREMDRTTGDQLDRVRRLRIEADYKLTGRHSGASHWQKQWTQTHALVTRLLTRIPNLEKK